MITIYSEKKEVRNSAMPLQKKNSVDTESIISDSLVRMRELIKRICVLWKNRMEERRKAEMTFIYLHLKVL